MARLWVIKGFPRPEIELVELLRGMQTDGPAPGNRRRLDKPNPIALPIDQRLEIAYAHARTTIQLYAGN